MCGWRCNYICRCQDQLRRFTIIYATCSHCYSFIVHYRLSSAHYHALLLLRFYLVLCCGERFKQMMWLACKSSSGCKSWEIKVNQLRKIFRNIYLPALFPAGIFFSLLNKLLSFEREWEGIVCFEFEEKRDLCHTLMLSIFPWI